MGKEIERKFLVANDTYRRMACRSIHMRQGYLSVNPQAIVRVRVADDKAFITVKGMTSGAARDEWEYGISVVDAAEMLDRLCSDSVIEKIRYIVPFGGMTWEVDEFIRPCSGLVVAEIELNSEFQSVALPEFIGDEVTGNPEFYNSNIAKSMVCPPIRQ